MSPSGHALRSILARAARRLRVEGAQSLAIVMVGLVAAALIVSLAVGGWGPRGPGPLLLWVVVAGAGAVIVAVFGRRWVGGVNETSVAAAAERARELPSGSLRGVLELGRELPRGVSGALFRRSESQLAGRLAGASARDLGGDLGLAARRRRGRALATAAVLVLVVGAAGFAAPGRARAAWGPLLAPVTHLRGPVLPEVVVTPGDTAVDRGRPLEVRIEAPLRSRVTLHWRTEGDVPREHTVPLEEGRADAAVGPVDAELSYWVRAPDGAVSDTFTATPRDPLMMTGLTVEITYPPHVGRPPDHYRGDPPLLQVPEGTRLSVAGVTSAPLSAAGVRHEAGAERAATLDGDRFHLEWTLDPSASGRWDWTLVGDDGENAIMPSPLEVRVVEDAPPEVRIGVPGADTLMPPSMRQPILAEAADDYGLTSAALVFRRVDAQGQRGAASTAALPLALAAGSAGRASLRGVLDASGQPLVPGDAIEYHVLVRDNSPDRQVGRSATYLLRLPSMSDLRERARREAGEVLDATRRLADRARELESNTRDLSRSAGSRARPGSSGGQPGQARPPGRVGFEEASEARDLAAQHEDVLARVDELRSRMAELQRAIEDAGLRDPELQRRLAELRQLSDQLVTPELKEQVEALREAAESLDPEAVNEALDRLAERQEEFRKQIEQSLEMMRRAAAEQEMNALARQAEEIAARQEALAEAMSQELQEPIGGDGAREMASGADPASPSHAVSASDPASPATASDPAAVTEKASTPEPASAVDPASDSAGASRPSGESASPQGPMPQSRAEQQDGLEEQARELGKSLQALQQQLLQMGEQESSSQTGAAEEKGKASQKSMKQAAEEARRDRGAQAAASGQRAASQMADAARTLDQARQQMAESRQREARQAVQEATQEALSMAQRQESLRQRMEDAQRQGGSGGQSLQQMRSDQAALQQGLQQLSRNLGETGQRSAMIDPQVGRALERAVLNMDRTLEGLREGGAMPMRQAERSVESLNQLALSLLENDGATQQGPSPGALQQALRRLGEAAREQGSLNGRASALAPMQLKERAMTRQLQQVAEQQRAVARRIGDVSGMVGGREDVLGQLDRLSTEAEQIARDLHGGRLDPEVLARQDRLFHRLLDAGRSLEREEYSDERVGGAPRHAAVPAPVALDPALIDPAVRYPAPTAEQLERLPPAYRRLILEYFDRLNRVGGGR